MADSIRVRTRSIQDLRNWIIMHGQYGPCATELLECLMIIDELRASQPLQRSQTTLGIAEAFSPSDQEIEEWADEADLIPDEELVADEQWQRCFLPGQFYATIRAALARWGSPAALAAQPPAATPLDIDVLLSPEGAYERGNGAMEGAQLVSGPHGPEWWEPAWGCDSLDNLLDRLRERILPHLRPPIAGIDVPGGDGDYGDVLDLCAAEGVDPRVGVPLLKRARRAWKVAAQPPTPTPAPAAVPAAVPVPENADQAALMVLLGHQWLAHNAPERLRTPAPAAVPVAERPWERPGWCDEDGRCWWGRCADEFFNPEWVLATHADIQEFCSDAMPELCLPHWAIPVPQPPQGGEVQSNG